jgi:phosphatidylglycerophosphate synthase
VCGKWVLAPPHTGYFPGAGRFVYERRTQHGELQLTLLDTFELILVAVLGFLPLIIIHWADRRPLLRLKRLKRSVWRPITTKIGLVLVSITDWFDGIML